MTFLHKLEKRWAENKFVCIGLDPEIEKLPKHLTTTGTIATQLFTFNKAIIDATHDLVCAYKPNSAFYEAYGVEGIQALKDTCDYLFNTHPNIMILLDAKRGDIDSTNTGYKKYAFDYLRVDGMTIHPYLGEQSLAPLFENRDKGFFVLVRTSNDGSNEFQELVTERDLLYKEVARQVATRWNWRGNCGVVVGATYPDELKEVRALVGDMPILIPGIGAQGGDLEATIAAGQNSRGQGMIVSSSRSIIYASNGGDFAHAARTATEQLTQNIQQLLQ